MAGRCNAMAAAVATAFASACVASMAAQAQGPQPQRGGTFIEPPAKVDPIYLPVAPNQRTQGDNEPGPERARSTHGVDMRLSLDHPLRSGAGTASGSGTQGSPPVSPTVRLSLRWQPIENAEWFVQTSLYHYLRPERRQPWNPDFTYAFGYDDWRPGTWSLVYSNYAGNQFQPDRARGEARSNFSQGTWSVGYKFALPEALEPYLLVGNGDQGTCRSNLNFTPRFTDVAGGALRHGKTSVSFGCRYTLANGWYAELTAFAYPDRGQQQPWDPDYTYALGYFDWRPGTVSLQYGNYSGNRFPGRERTPGQGGTPRAGTLSLSWTTSW